MKFHRIIGILIKESSIGDKVAVVFMLGVAVLFYFYLIDPSRPHPKGTPALIPFFAVGWFACFTCYVVAVWQLFPSNTNTAAIY